MSDRGSAAAGWEAPAARRARWPTALAVLAGLALAAVLLQSGDDDPGGGIAVRERETPAAPERQPSPAASPGHPAPAASPGHPSPGASPGPPTDASPERPRGAARHPDWWPRNHTVGTWVTLPSAGIGGRAAPLVVWTGERAQQAAEAQAAAYEPFVRGLVLVWGGVDDSGRLADGAAYDPFTGLWRRLPPAPLPWGPNASAAKVWTGQELLTVGAPDDGGPEQWMAYDPAEDRWREPATPPAELDDWQAAGWTGAELVVLAADGSQAGAYDPGADTWRPLAPPPLAADRGALRMVTLPDGLAVLGLAGHEPAVSVLPAGDDAWTAPEPMPRVEERLFPLLASVTADGPGGRLLVVGTNHQYAERRHAWEWAPDRGWRRLPDLESRAFGDRPAVAWSGGHLLAWLGDGRYAGAVLADGGEVWRPMAPPPLARRRDAGAAWTGQSLVVWGGQRGQVWLDDGALFIPE